MKSLNDLEIEFKQNLKNFFPEIVLRIIYLILSCIVFESEKSHTTYNQSYFTAILFIVFNFLIFWLTIYGTKRRKTTITNFIEMRIKTHSIYSNVNLKYTSNFLSSAFYVFVIFSSILFTVSILMVLMFLKFDNHNLKSMLFVSLTFGVPCLYFFVLWYFKINFISKEIVSVKHNGKVFNHDEFEAFIRYLYHQPIENEVYYVNDSIIYDLEEKANIYKIRVETLLIESVFIGALTFGTFIQLTSPESITSFGIIDFEEKQLHKDSANYQNKNVNAHLTYLYEQFFPFDTISFDAKKKNITNGKQLKTLENSISHFLNNDSNTEKLRDNNDRIGFFNSWAYDRQYTILSFFYKQFIPLKGFNSDTFEIINLNDNYKKSNPLIPKLRDTLQSTILDTVNIHNKHNFNLAQIDSLCRNKPNIIKYLLRQFDQSQLIKLSGVSPYEASPETRLKILEILKRYDEKKHDKYLNIIKKHWNEQEYLFLIAVGSIICSVLYISVLISRLPIIVRIENLFSELKKAKMWNKREEDSLANSIRAEYEESPLIMEKFQKRREVYTEKLQVQLSRCDIVSSKIETHIQIISFFRNLGLYTFFTVLLISTMMLDPKFTLILSTILIYTMISSSFMEEGSNIRKFWKRITRTGKSNTDQDEYDFI